MGSEMCIRDRNCTGLNESKVPQPGDTVYVNYTASKLDLFSFGKILEALLSTGGLSMGTDTETTMNLVNDIPNLFASMGIDIDRVVSDLIKYLRVNLSDPVKGYGIKPFEMLDIAMILSSMYSSGSASGANPLGDVSQMLSDTNLINALVESVIKKILSKVDPFGLMKEFIGNPLPWLDYLNRSKIFTKDFILPLVSGLFSGEETMLSEFPWDSVLNALVPIISEMLSGPGGTVIENHGALNVFSLIAVLDAALKVDPEDVIFTNQPIYTNGMGNYTIDMPPYDNLHLLTYLCNGLLNSGLDVEDIWAIIESLLGLGIYGESNSQTNNQSSFDFIGSFSDLIPLVGFLAPPTEWISFLRELGIFSRWEGDWECLIWIWVNLFGRWGPFGPIDIAAIVGPLMNLEKFLATGKLELLPELGFEPMEFIRLCLLENQSYSNPWYYYVGYDTSHNTGPYREAIGQGSSDNWGWAPIGWDPGNPDADPPTYPPKGSEYARSFIQNVISGLPIAVDIDIPEISFSIPFSMFIFDIIINMTLPLDLPIRLRLQGNVWYFMKYLEESGITVLGLITHFLGPTTKQLVLDIISPSGQENASTMDVFDIVINKILDDPVPIIESFFSSGVDLMHLFRFFFDPTYMPTSQWQLDSSYIDPAFILGEENVSIPNLYWDRKPDLGDRDQIPDEFPWYRFSIPVFNQDPDWVNAGPDTENGRNPALIDQLTPNGPPGSGKWLIQPNGIPDGIEHYWYDTPFAYVNATCPIDDPSHPYYVWLNTDPLLWNDPGVATNPITGANRLIELPDEYWDNAPVPYYALYYVPPGTESGSSLPEFNNRPGVGVAGRLPDPVSRWYQITEASTSVWSSYTDSYGYFPNIWWCFNDTMIQKDYRFGYWDTYYDEVLGKNVKFLNTQPFWDILSWGVTPHILGALDLLDLASLIQDLMQSTGTSRNIAPGDLLAGVGKDYYHIIKYDSVYKKYNIPKEYGLSPLGMLQWIWDGAGTYYNKTDGKRYTYVEPYTVPNFQAALDWLADRGFSLSYIINNLPSILNTFLTIESPTSSDFGELMGTDSIVGLVKGLEQYFWTTVGENEFGNPNRTKGTIMFLSLIHI